MNAPKNRECRKTTNLRFRRICSELRGKISSRLSWYVDYVWRGAPCFKTRRAVKQCWTGQPLVCCLRTPCFSLVCLFDVKQGCTVVLFSFKHVWRCLNAKTCLTHDHLNVFHLFQWNNDFLFCPVLRPKCRLFDSATCFIKQGAPRQTYIGSLSG